VKGDGRDFAFDECPRADRRERKGGRRVEDLDPSDQAYAYCPRCRTALVRRKEGGLARPACPACGFVQYINPAPGAGIVLMRGDRICLVKRRFEPRKGQWTLPIGFQEWNESIETAAVREAKEETGLDIALDEIFGVYSGVLPPDRAVVVTIFRAREVGGALRAGDDAAEVGFFPVMAPPGPIAFGIHRRVLRELSEQRGGGIGAGGMR
jgi:ADP-ribose pyrophosphatase YjhB (NUDIX family)